MNTKISRAGCSHPVVTRIVSLILSFAMLLSITACFDFTAKAAVGDNFYLYYDYIDSRTDDVEITGYEGDIDYLAIPEYLDEGQKVVSIDFAAFRDMDCLKGVVIPNTVTAISSCAFESCSNLEYVVLSDNLIEMGTSVFSNCTNLYRVVSHSSNALPKSLSFVNSYTFYCCKNLINLHFTGGPDFGSCVFKGCDSLRSIVFERSFVTVWNDTFDGLSDLTTIRFYGTEEQWAYCFHQTVWDKNVIYNCTACNTEEEHESKWIHAGNSFFMCCEKCGDITYELSFKDLSAYGDYYFDYFLYTSVYNEFIKGTNPPLYSQFSPKMPITRAMLITILYRMAGEPYANNNSYSSSPFTDITDTSVYYYDAACWALKNGITTETTFKPFNNVTREQTATFLYRYAQDNDTLGSAEYKNVNFNAYHDGNSISHFAVDAMKWANYNGMITGTQQGYANPQGATQRIHATKILYGFGKACNIGNFA